MDVRGSVGYGREFRDKLLGDYGGIDIEDLESGVRYLKTLGYADTDRVGIWGSSYGGLMTAMSLFKKPGLYKAGVAAAPATNVRHAMTGQVNVAGRPNTQPEVYRKTSAGELGEELQDALLIVHGMQDGVVLFKDSMVLAEKLMMLGKDFDIVMSPSSVHEWSVKPYVARHVLGKIVSHFERNLGGGPRPALTVDRIASLPRLFGNRALVARLVPGWTAPRVSLERRRPSVQGPLGRRRADGSGLSRVTDLSRAAARRPRGRHRSEARSKTCGGKRRRGSLPGSPRRASLRTETLWSSSSKAIFIERPSPGEDLVRLTEGRRPHSRPRFFSRRHVPLVPS